MSSTPENTHLASAVSALRRGGVIACPTEAVWGLSCDPFCHAAVEHLLGLKRRPAHKGLILVAASQEQISFLLSDLSTAQQAMLDQTWPGPNTWLVPHRGLVPRNVCGEHDKVAVRVSAHPVVEALCNAFGGALVSTSANHAGSDPALDAPQVKRCFPEGLDYILPGRLGARARPSTIRDLASGEIVRD